MQVTLNLEARLTNAQQRVEYVQNKLSELSNALASYKNPFVSNDLLIGFNEEYGEGRFTLTTYRTVGADYAHGEWVRRAALCLESDNIKIYTLKGDTADDLMSFDAENSFTTILDIDIESFNTALKYAVLKLQNWLNRKVKAENSIL